MSVLLAESYSEKAQECLREADSAYSQTEKRRWIELAEHWSALALEANPSGALPWRIESEGL